MKRFLPVIIWIGYAALLGWLSFRLYIVWWSVGIIIAAALFLVDRFLYVWWLKPYEQLSIQIQYWWKLRDYKAALQLLHARSHEQTKLILRSVLFMLIWPLLALYILTSTGSVGAIGVIMGLGLGLTLDVLYDWHDYRTLRQWLCWQIKREMHEREVRVIAGSFIIIFCLISLTILV